MDIGSLTGQVALEDQLTDKVTMMAEHVAKFATDFDGMVGGVAIGALAIGAAIAGAVISIVSLGDHGADINDIASTLDRFAGSAENATAIMDKMREGTLGTVNNLDLMKSSSKLLAAGLNLTADNFKTLTSAAFVLQNQGLGPTKDMLELVNTAMLTGRTRGLELKIGKIDLSHAEENFAKTLGTTADKLNAVGKIEAKRIGLLEALDKKVKAAGVQERDFGEQLEFATATLANWEEELASAVASSADVNTALSTVGAALGKLFNSESQSLMDLIISGINAFARGVTVATPYVLEFVKGGIALFKIIYDLAPVIEVVVAGFVAYGVATIAVAAYTATATAAAGLYTSVITSLTVSAYGGAVAVDTMTLSVSSFALAVGALIAGYKLGSWLEENTKLGREFSDSFEYAALRVQGYSAAEADAMIAQDKLTEAMVKQTKAAKAASAVPPPAAPDPKQFIDLGKGIDAAAAAAKALREELTKVREGLTGISAVQAFEKIKSALGGAIDVTKLTNAGMKQVQSSVDAAIAGYHAMGAHVPPDVQKVSDEIKNLLAYHKSLDTMLVGLKIRYSDLRLVTRDMSGAVPQVNASSTGKMPTGILTSAQIDWGAIAAQSTQSLQNIADKAQNTYAYMAARSGEFSQATIQHFKEIALGASDAAAGTQGAWETSFGKVKSYIDTLAGGFVALGQIGGASFGPLMQSFGAMINQLKTGMSVYEQYRSQVVKTHGDAAGAAVKDFGIATPLFDSNSSTAEKWASGISSGMTIASGAMDVWSSTAQDATKSEAAMHGAMSGAKAGAAFGVYGAAVGAVAGAVAGMIHQMTIGRRTVEDFAKSFDTAAKGSGFDELHAKMTSTLGDTMAEKFWVQLTQGVKKGDKAGAQAVISAIQDAMSLAEANDPVKMAGAAGYRTIADLKLVADQAVKTYEYMRDSGLYTAAAVADAFEKSSAAQIDAMDSTSKAAISDAQKVIDTLDAQIKDLQASVNAEAAEEVMGSVETAQRAQLEGLEAQRAAAQTKVDDLNKQIEDTVTSTVAAAQSAAAAAGSATVDAIQDALNTHRFKVHVDVETGGTSGTPPGYAAGGIVPAYYSSGINWTPRGTDTVPAMLTPGERVLTAQQQRDEKRAITVPITLMVGSEVLAKKVVETFVQGGL